MYFKIILKKIQNSRKHIKTQYQTYNDMRKEAKVKIENLVRKHQPQEDVDTIRSMINKYGERNGGELYNDNCFYVKMLHQKLKKIIMVIQKRGMMMFILSLEADKDFLTSYYRDE